MTEPKKPSLRRRGFLSSLLAGAGAAVVTRQAAAAPQPAAPEPPPPPPPPPTPPRIPAAVRPCDGTGDLLLYWRESLESHEDLPESPEEGDAYFIRGGKYADHAFVAICESDFRGWITIGGFGGNQ